MIGKDKLSCIYNIALLLTSCAVAILCISAAASGASEPAIFMQPSAGQETPVSNVIFTWPPQQDCVFYRIVIAEDAEMTTLIVDRQVYGTAFVYPGTLKNGNSYYWRVMPVDPAPGDWSAVCSFSTMPAAAPILANAKQEPPVPGWAISAIIVMSILIVIGVVLVLRTGSDHI